MKKIIFLALCVHILALHAYAQTIDNPQVVVQLGHSEWITSIAVSPDGRVIASASLDATIKLWDIASGRLLRTLVGHSDTVKSIAFSPDGLTLVSGSYDKTVRIWDSITGKTIHTLTGHNTSVKAVAFSYDGKIIATGCDDAKVKLWDVATGKELKTLSVHRDSITSVTFSPDNRLIASASKDGKIILWEINTGKPLRLFTGHTRDVNSIAFSKDGKVLISGSSDATVKVWNVISGKLENTLQGHHDVVLAVAFNGDGKYIASGSADDTIKIWEYATGKELLTLAGHKNVVSSIAFLQEGRYLVSGSWDNTIKLWDVAKGKEVKAFSENTDWIYSVALSPDGTYVAAGTDSKSIQLWNLSKVNDLTLLADHKGSVFAVRFSPDGRLLASGSYDGTVKLWSVPGNKLLKTLKGHTEGVTSVAFSPDGKYVVSASSDGTLRLWDVQRGVVVHTFKGHEGSVDTVAFSPDGSLIASGGYDRTIRIWAIATKKEVKRLAGHESRVLSLAFSPDGKLLISGSGDTTVRLWDVTSGQCVKTFTGHSDKVYCVTFSPDSTTVVSGSSDTTIKLWDVNTYKPIKTIHTHTYVISLVVSKDNKYLVSGGKDCKVRIWDIGGKEIAQCIATVNGEWAVVTPDNYYFCNKATLGSIHFVKGLKVFGFDQYDLQFNRPDVVLERLDKAPQNLVVAYRKAYEKRLRKMGFDPSRFEKELTFNVPQIAISIPESGLIVTNSPNYTVRLTAQDNLYVLERIFVKVNGVPLYGVKGKLLEVKSKTINQTLNIPLSTGKNAIAISVLNEKGVESLAERFDVQYTPLKLTKPNLYIVAIGTSKFKQEEYNLTYADKDAQDIVKLFEQKKDTFGAIKVFSLLNENAIREKIIQLKSELRTTTPDDYVVVFVASHGLLDDNLDYYIATYDIDFTYPQGRGLRYEELEDILDGIPARHKIMFIDACHSGEIDKDEIQLEAQQGKSDKNVKSRGFTVVKTKDHTIGLRNSFELMKELFADLRRHNGAVVISSAGGKEYAYESAQWKNGVFTFSIIEGLTMKKADSNKDGSITVSELMNYVAQRTRELTAGRQNPTSRKENVEIDVKIW